MMRAFPIIGFGGGRMSPQDRQLAEYLRARRESLQPEDVGLSRGPGRRVPGLRREEVADRAGISVEKK